MSQGLSVYARANPLAGIEWWICAFEVTEGVVENEHILHFEQADPRMVAGSIVFTKFGKQSLRYKLERLGHNFWATLYI